MLAGELLSVCSPQLLSSLSEMELTLWLLSAWNQQLLPLAEYLCEL